MTVRPGLKRVDQSRSMRHHDYSRAIGRCSNQPTERRQQIGMQTSLGLVEHQESWRSRSQERCHPQQIPQRTVGQLRRLQWTEQPMLLHLDLKPTIGVRDLYTGSGESIRDRLAQSVSIANLHDCLKSRCEVRAIVTEDGRVRADLRQPRRRGRIRPQLS
jgi:hypothetical protein